MTEGDAQVNRANTRTPVSCPLPAAQVVACPCPADYCDGQKWLGCRIERGAA